MIASFPVLTAAEAASLIDNGQNVGFSGFTPAGAPKAIPMAIADRAIAAHNAGKSTHTAKFVPWKVLWYSAFPDKHRALEFEKYLKSHSGRAFASKRLK